MANLSTALSGLSKPGTKSKAPAKKPYAGGMKIKEK